MSVAITPDNRFIISGSQDKSIAVYDLEKKAIHHILEEIHDGIIFNLLCNE